MNSATVLVRLVADGDEVYYYEVPQIQDEVTCQSGTDFGDLSASETRERRKTWNPELKHPWFVVPPNIRKAKSRSPGWSDPPVWPPGEPDTADTPGSTGLYEHMT